LFTNEALGLGTGGAAQAFTWLLNLSTVAGLIAWATLSFCYIRFHAAMKAQGVSRDTLPWKAPLQPYAAWVGFIGSTIITLIAGFPVFLKGNWNTSDFVASYVGIPIFIVPILAWKLWHNTKVSTSKNSEHSGTSTDSFSAVPTRRHYRPLVRPSAGRRDHASQESAQHRVGSFYRLARVNAF
jgi:amino acid permease